jgi:hypothetical protein
MGQDDLMTKVKMTPKSVKKPHDEEEKKLRTLIFRIPLSDFQVLEALRHMLEIERGEKVNISEALRMAVQAFDPFKDLENVIHESSPNPLRGRVPHQ